MVDRTPDRMNLHGGLPYWLLKNGLGEPYQRLGSDLRTEVVVIGGGITGALCTQHLAAAGVEVVVIDGRSIGTGSTCVSTALLQYEIDLPLHELAATVGMDKAVRSYQACAHAIHRLHTLSVEVGAKDFEFVPSVQFASKRAHVKGLRKEAELRRSHGFAVDFVEGPHVHRFVPFEAPAVLRSELGAQLDTWQFTHALHAWSIAHGAKVFAATEAIEVTESAGSVHVRTNTGAQIHARWLIYATGYETQDILPRGVLDLFSTYALVSDAGTAEHPWPFNAMIWETARPYLYLRTAPDGRIMIGGRDVPIRQPDLRDRLLKEKAEALVADFHRLFPKIPFRREFAWCGTFGGTRDALPIVDHAPRMKRALLALGMGGNGIVFSLVAAEILRDHILGSVHACADLFKLQRLA